MPKVKEVEQRKCADCGLEYDAGAPHAMFCAARTCTNCGTTFSHVLALTGNMIDVDDEQVAERICDDCLEDDIDGEEDEDD